MKFTDEQIMDIQNTCKEVCKGNLSVEEGNTYLKKYGLENSSYSKDGKAILKFSNGENLRFGKLLYHPGYYFQEENIQDEDDTRKISRR